MNYHYHVALYHLFLFIECDLSPASINRVGRILGDGKAPKSYCIGYVMLDYSYRLIIDNYSDDMLSGPP